jgi:hypothetical protein
MLFVVLLKRKDLFADSLERSYHLTKLQQTRDSHRQKNTKIGRTSNGMRFFGVTRLGYSQESILELGLLDELARKRSITKIVSRRGTKERSDRCFGGQ